MHPRIRSLWLSMALALLSLIELPNLNSTNFKSSMALGQTVAKDTREAEANRLKVEGEQAFQTSRYEEAIDKLQQALKLYQEMGNRDEQSATLNLLGMTYKRSSEYQKMGESYQQALTLAKESQNRQEEGIALNGLGDSYIFSYKSEYRKALEFVQQALNLCKDLPNPQCKVLSLRNMGRIYSDLGEREKALSYYNQSLLLSRAAGNRREEFNTLHNVGSFYRSWGEKQKALSFYNQALRLSRAVGDRREEFKTLDYIASLYEALGEDKKSLPYYNQALLLSRAMGDRREEFWTLHNTGRVHSFLGEKQKALSYYNQALLLSRETSDREGEVMTLNSIGRVYLLLKEQKKALSYYSQSLQSSRAAGDRIEKAKTLRDIGSVYETLNEKQKALSYYNQALLLSRAAGDRREEFDTLNTIGSVYRLLEDQQEALLLTGTVGDRFGEANSLYLAGSFYETLGEKQKALSHYNQALSLLRAVGNRLGEATTLNSIGRVYNALGEKQKALSYYNQALPLWRAVGNRFSEAFTLLGIGDLLAEQKETVLAIFFYKQYVNVNESMRNNVRGIFSDSEQYYMQTFASKYRTLAGWLLQQNRILEAQQILDLLKVQELEDYLKNVRGNSQTSKGVDFLQPEQQILTQFNEPLKTAIQLGEELSQLQQIPEAKRNPTQQQRITQLVALQEKLNQQFNDFIKSPAVQAAIDQLKPSILRQTVDLADLDALRDNLKQLNAVLLYPLILPDRLELIITPPDSAPLRRTVQLSSSELNKTILEFRQRMQACETKPCTKIDTEQVKSISQKLYSWLIKPLEADLKQANAQSIIYAPDGQLRYLPLAALHDGNQWLAQRLRINNITAKSLDNLAPQPNTPQLKVLAGAFTEGRYQFNVGTQQFSFDGLPFAKKEIAQLVAAVPGTTQFLDQSFSLAAVKPRMNEYNVLHLATHAAFLPGQPENSFILFGNGDRATLRDIESWTLNNVDMVILSACETGLGLKLGDGVEILGLGYQFQNRGVKATIASLWQVNDESTQILMNTLYTQLKKGNIPTTEALRQAQLTLMQSKGSGNRQTKGSISVQPKEGTSLSSQDIDYNHPYYWASFILIGNGL
jgi:CHAT domain-containing protein